MDKYVGYMLAILGIILIAIGALNVAGYLSFQVVDTTTPTIFYTYPTNGMTYKTSDLSEIIVYAKDESSVVSASYNDKYGLKALAITPYTQLKHPYVIEGWKYPDVNFDGKVDDADMNLLQSAYYTKVGDSRYNPAYDLNSDGIINLQDTTKLTSYYGSVTFALSITSRYSAGENVTFIFSALDGVGNVATMSGSFNVQDYEQLLGSWKINDKTVTDNMAVELSESKANVVFICNDTTVTVQDVTVKVTVGSTVSYLTYAGSYTWQGSIEFTPGTSTVILEASVQVGTPKMNKIAVTVITPEAPTFTIGHALMLSGGVLFIVGLIVLKKKSDVEW